MLSWLLLPAALLGTMFLVAWRALPMRRKIPFLVSPPVVLFGAPALAAAGFASSRQAEAGEFGEYLALIGPAVLGISCGALVGGILPRQRSKRPSYGSPATWVWAMALVGAGAMSTYVLLLGSPLSAANVETARAEAGAGYLRVLGHVTIPAAVIATAYAVRHRYAITGTAILSIALLGNRSPLVYLIGTLLLGSMLRHDGRRPKYDHAGQDRTRPGVMVAVGVAALLLVVIGGAVLRVVLTPDYREYEEYSEDLATGDYLGIGIWSLRHYGGTVGTNGLTTKALVDEGALAEQRGLSYLSGVITALPGEQLTLDLKIKEAARASFIGGGIPPTLAGEGYANFGVTGSFAGAAVLAAVYVLIARQALRGTSPLDQYIYGYMTIYFCLAQVAGIAGASPLPLLLLLTLLASRRWISAHGRTASSQVTSAVSAR